MMDGRRTMDRLWAEKLTEIHWVEVLSLRSLAIYFGFQHKVLYTNDLWVIE